MPGASNDPKALQREFERCPLRSFGKPFFDKPSQLKYYRANGVIVFHPWMTTVVRNEIECESMMNDETNDFNESIDVEPSEPARFPVGVKIAGIIWIIYGVLQILSSLLQIALTNAKSGSICGWFIALAFIVIGLQTINGTAKGTLQNGIGSIVISLLIFLVGMLFLMFGTGVFQLDNMDRLKMYRLEFIVATIICLATGSFLMLAGILAITGRGKYDAWRNTHQKK